MTTIRAAREDEYDKVGDLLAQAYAQYGPSSGDPPELLKAWGEYRAEIPDVRSRLHDSELIVAEVDGALLGAVTFYAPSKANPDGWAPGYAAFRLLAVHPDARGIGLGRAITQWCIARATGTGARYLGLHTTPLMDVARAMYQRMGFERFPENDHPITDEFIVEAYRLKL